MPRAAIYLNSFNVIWVVQFSAQKYSAFAVGQITSISLRRLTPDTRGGSRVVTNAGWDAVDAAALGAR
jgi:hypothetical protein